ncbi:hypothetical protein PK35_16385 [Tamlana nanhaiensis]|uniref:Uncharacterized protein n=2 Tax=Neotamlana nanhaiensis TaxID=1382798 RepID=A0A0D7VZM8_9FLAO|nr:hypothetical protein PK35_16385 [Tamlana nanhaiensis]
MEYLYGLMSKAQKASAEPFPKFPPPPPPPTVPSTTNNTLSPELLKLKTDYEKESKQYSKAIQLYLKENKGTRAELNEQFNSVMKLYIQYSKKSKKEKIIPIIPPPSPLPPSKTLGNVENIPTPPESKSSLERIKDLEKKGAMFYYKNEKISFEKAKKIIQKKHITYLGIDIHKINNEIFVKLSTD